jgi:serine/threonine protein phosphatase PrpC
VRGAGLTAGPAAGDASGVGPALARAFRAVDSQVLRAARADGKDYGSTATVALCFTAQRTLYVAHVGDSRSVLARRAAAAAQP